MIYMNYQRRIKGPYPFFLVHDQSVRATILWIIALLILVASISAGVWFAGIWLADALGAGSLGMDGIGTGDLDMSMGNLSPETGLHILMGAYFTHLAIRALYLSLRYKAAVLRPILPA